MKITSYFLCAALFWVVGCSSESGGKSTTVTTRESVSQSDTAVILDDGTENELFESNDFKLTFESPTQESLKIGTEGLTIKVRPWNQPPTATWGLFYTTSFKDLTTARPIFEGLPISVQEVTWNTSSMKSGEYYLYAEGRAGTQRSIYWLASRIEVSADGPSGAPAVVISTPLDRSYFKNGDTLKVEYTAVTSDGSAVVFNVFLSPDNGTTWQQLENSTNKKSTEFIFDQTYAQSASYKIKVEADNGTLIGATSSEGNFGFSATPVNYNADIKAVVEAKCASSGCHSAKDAAGANNFNATRWADGQDSNGSFTGVTTNKEKIYSRTRTEGDMPPAAAPQLSQAEKDLIALWSWAGYKQAP